MSGHVLPIEHHVCFKVHTCEIIVDYAAAHWELRQEAIRTVLAGICQWRVSCAHKLRLDSPFYFLSVSNCSFMCLVHLRCQYAGQKVKCESSSENGVAITHYQHGDEGEKRRS